MKNILNFYSSARKPISPTLFVGILALTFSLNTGFNLNTGIDPILNWTRLKAEGLIERANDSLNSLVSRSSAQTIPSDSGPASLPETPTFPAPQTSSQPSNPQQIPSAQPLQQPATEAGLPSNPSIQPAQLPAQQTTPLISPPIQQIPQTPSFSATTPAVTAPSAPTAPNSPPPPSPANSPQQQAGRNSPAQNSTEQNEEEEEESASILQSSERTIQRSAQMLAMEQNYAQIKSLNSPYNYSYPLGLSNSTAQTLQYVILAIMALSFIFISGIADATINLFKRAVHSISSSNRVVND
jgi:hypothetical protein